MTIDKTLFIIQLDFMTARTQRKEAGTLQRRRFRFGIRSALLLLLLVSLGFGLRVHFQVAYHRIVLAFEPINERYEHHIARLVDLGHFAEIRIPLQNVQVESQAAQKIQDSAAMFLRKTGTPFIVSRGPYGNDAWPDQFEIQCHPEFIDEIEQMVSDGDR